MAEDDLETTGYMRVTGEFLPLGARQEDKEPIALTHGGDQPFILIRFPREITGNIDVQINCTGMKADMMREVLLEIVAGLHDKNLQT